MHEFGVEARYTYGQEENTSDRVHHCRSIEKRQRTQEELAMIRRGELKVLEGYSDLCVDDVTFFRKTEAQKKAVYAKFFNANVRSSSLSSILEDSQSESVASATLSVPPENSKILSVHTRSLKKSSRMPRRWFRRMTA